jgi:hypothetical protein
MSALLVEHEHTHNRLLLALSSRSPDHRIQFAPLLQQMQLVNAVLLVPQSVVCVTVNVTPEFVLAHACVVQHTAADLRTPASTPLHFMSVWH